MRIMSVFLASTSMLVGFATPASANIFGDKLGYEAKFGVDKKICLGDPTQMTQPEQCQAENLVGSNTDVFYVITTENPWGEPQQTIRLDDNYPSGFTPSGPVTCTDSSGGPVSVIAGGTAPTIAEFTLPIAEKVHCFIPGQFSSSGQKSNTVEALNRTGYQQSSKSNVTVARTTRPLGSDLSVTKKVKPAVLNTRNGQGAMVYTITVTNNGPAAVNVGSVFELHDKLSLLPNSVPFRASLNGSNCTSTPGTDCPSAPFQYGSGNILVGTAAPENFLRWSFPANQGQMAVGGSFTIEVEVMVNQLKGLSCIRAPRSDGLRNTAFFTLAKNGTAMAESNPANNTATVTSRIETGNSTIVQDCGRGHLRVSKTQLKPSSPENWGPNKYYEITVENRSIPPQDITIPVGGIEDWVTQGINTPPFTASSKAPTCNASTDPQVCNTLNASFANQPAFRSTFYGQSHKRWDTSAGKSIKLAHGDSFTLFTDMDFSEPDCETVPAAPSKPITNTARIRYSATAYGATSASAPQQGFVQSADSTIKMKDQPACKFVVTKEAQFKGPIKFGVPAKYSVTFTNNGDRRQVGTVMDALRIAQPGYAHGLPFTSKWSCTNSGSVAGYARSGSYSSGQVGNVSSPAQGSGVANFRSRPGQPIVFDSGASLKCDISVTVTQPPLESDLCTSAPTFLENTALMDVTYPFNSNIHWPPSGSYSANQMSNPSKQDKNWASVQAQLPKCIDLTLNKAATVPGLPGGSSLWSYANGPDISYELDIRNDSQSTLNQATVYSGSNWPFNGVVVEDYLPGAAYAGQGGQRINSQCNLPAPFCSQSTINPNRMIGIRNLLAGTVGKWTYDIPGSMLKVDKDIENCAVLNPQGAMNPNQGTYYTNFASPVQARGSSAQSDCVTVPVIRTTTINITKEIDDQTGAGISTGGPFEFTATCAPYAMFAGTDKVSVMAGATGTLNNVPARSSCTLTESNRPPVPQAAIDACAQNGGPGVTAQWRPVQFTPNSQLRGPLDPNGVNVTAVNRLECKEAQLARFKIRKEFDIDKSLRGLMGNWPYTFDVLCTPGGAAPNSATMTLPSGTSNVATFTAPAGSTCTITEALPPFPPKAEAYCASKRGRLPRNMTPKPTWKKPVYSLPNPMQLTANNMEQVVTNSWSCEIPTVVINGGPGGVLRGTPVLTGPGIKSPVITPPQSPPKRRKTPK